MNTKIEIIRSTTKYIGIEKLIRDFATPLNFNTISKWELASFGVLGENYRIDFLLTSDMILEESIYKYQFLTTTTCEFSGVNDILKDLEQFEERINIFCDIYAEALNNSMVAFKEESINFPELNFKIPKKLERPYTDKLKNEMLVQIKLRSL